MNNLVSVVVATYNCATTLERCLSSISNQSYENIELVVIDGGSTDESIKVIQKYSENIHYFVSEPDDGIAAAWNKGLRQCHGEYVVFLGGDDFYWSSDVMALMVKFSKKQSRLPRIVYGKVARYSKEGVLLSMRGAPWSRIKNDFFSGSMRTPHLGMFFHKSVFLDHGEFDEGYRIAIDYEFLMREFKCHSPIFFPDIPIVGMRMGGVSNHPGSRLLSLQEIRKVLLDHGVRRCCVRVNFLIFISRIRDFLLNFPIRQRG